MPARQTRMSAPRWENTFWEEQSQLSTLLFRFSNLRGYLSGSVSLVVRFSKSTLVGPRMRTVGVGLAGPSAGTNADAADRNVCATVRKHFLEEQSQLSTLLFRFSNLRGYLSGRCSLVVRFSKNTSVGPRMRTVGVGLAGPNVGTNADAADKGVCATVRKHVFGGTKHL